MMHLYSSSLPVTSNYASLPGHTNNTNICCAKFGQTKMYFYMTQEKHEIGQQLVKQINAKQIQLVPDVYENPKTVKMAALASIFPENYLPHETVRDPVGQNVLNQYAFKAKQIVERIFNLHIVGESREINFSFSHDSQSFHRDSFPQQFQYVAEHFDPDKQYVMVQDLSLMDWDMADQTISGTLLHDPIGQDRFLISLLPKDEVTMLSVEPISHNGMPPQDPGAALLPFHTILSPEDVDGCETAGSSKGQRISMVLRGLIDKKEEWNIDQNATELPIMRPYWNGEIFQYDNGIQLRAYAETGIPDFPLIHVNFLPEKQNVDIIEIPLNLEVEILFNEMKNLFEMRSGYNLINCFRIIKRDGGFTSLKELELPIPSDSIILLINRSVLPNGYKNYPIAEDQSDQGLPWIQFFQFNPNLIMKITSGLYQRLTFAPLVEVIYRDEMQYQSERKSCKKFSTKIDLLVFSKTA